MAKHSAEDRSRLHFFNTGAFYLEMHPYLSPDPDRTPASHSYSFFQPGMVPAKSIHEWILVRETSEWAKRTFNDRLIEHVQSRLDLIAA